MERVQGLVYHRGCTTSTTWDLTCRIPNCLSVSSSIYKNRNAVDIGILFHHLSPIPIPIPTNAAWRVSANGVEGGADDGGDHGGVDRAHEGGGGLIDAKVDSVYVGGDSLNDDGDDGVEDDRDEGGDDGDGDGAGSEEDDDDEEEEA